MKYVLETKILDIKGQPLKEGNEELTLSAILCNAMLGVGPDDRNLSSDQKVRMFKLAQKATAGGSAEFSIEDIAFIKERVGKLYGPLVVGRVYDILEKESVSESEAR